MRLMSQNLVIRFFDQIRHKPAFAGTANMFYLGSEKQIGLTNLHGTVADTRLCILGYAKRRVSHSAVHMT